MPIMATKSNPSFCERCRVARAVHHILTRACGAFVAPGSAEAHELRRAHLALISTPLPPALDDEAATLRMLADANPSPSRLPRCGRCDLLFESIEAAAKPCPNGCDDEVTVETPTLTDAQLLAEWKARAEELGVLA